MALCLLVSATKLGKFWLWVICLLMIYPAIIGWLGFNGIGILLNVLPQIRQHMKDRPLMERLLIGSFGLVGVTFTALATWFVFIILRRMLA